jgi:pimeloyl-ACP methyl ester carboxylesterase
VEEAEDLFDPNLLDHFDIVSWDPRGTGLSAPVDCVNNLDPYLSIDPSPDTPAEKQALMDIAKQFDAACESSDGPLLPYISTQNTARDMDRVRAALGEGKARYFGFSYGSELGAVYATMFPSEVAAMAIDGADDPNADDTTTAVQQATGLERTLDHILSDCANDSSCPFFNGGDPASAFDRLWASLDTHPLVVSGSKGQGRPPVNQGVAFYGVLDTLYSETLWPKLTEALAAAQDGDGSKLLALYDDYGERNPDGTWSNTLEANVAISCVDDTGSRDPASQDELARKLEAAAPRLGSAIAYDYDCDFWPAPAAPKLTVTGKGAGPIVVLGNLGDPITPIESTRGMARDLEDGRLVTLDGQGHTAYATGNRCIENVVDAYFIQGTVPADGTTCS